MEYFRSEIKTGAVVFICLGLLILLTFSITGIKTAGGTYEITVLFKNAKGLEKDSPVNFSGFEVGKVGHIRLASKKERAKYPEYYIAAELKINSLAPLRQNSIVSINTLGYLGLKYINISPGTSDAKLIEPGETLLGFTPQDINEIIEMVGNFIKRIRPKIHNILNGLEDIAGESGSLTLTIEELRGLIQNADDVIKVNKKDIESLISNLEETSANLKVFSSDIKDHPWKLLIKTRENKEKKSRKTEDTETAVIQSNFGPR